MSVPYAPTAKTSVVSERKSTRCERKTKYFSMSGLRALQPPQARHLVPAHADGGKLLGGGEQPRGVEHDHVHRAKERAERDEPGGFVLDRDAEREHRAFEHDELQPPADEHRVDVEEELPAYEEELRADVQRRQREVLAAQIPEREAAKWRAPRREQPMAALSQGLQRAARPAVALAQELERALGCLGEDDGARLIDHVPAGAEELHREV